MSTDRLSSAGLSTPRMAGIAGIVFSVLFTTTLLLVRVSPSLSSVELAQAIAGPMKRAESLVALFLVPFAGITFLWFVGVVRDRIGAQEDRFFSTVFLASGVIFVSMLFTTAAIIAALTTTPLVTPEIAEFGRGLARAALFVYGARTAGVFTLVTSTIVLRTNAVPRWAAGIGYVIGLALLFTVRWFDLLLVLFPLWVALISVLILLGVHRERTAQH